VHILFVCSGNICRSPLAERLTRALAAEAFGPGADVLTASSAGTDAVVGHGMDTSSAAVLLGLGGDPTGFRARQLTPGMVTKADLVLTMTGSHRREVLEASPRAMSRTFTLLEAAALLEDLPTEQLPTGTDVDRRGHELMQALARRRAMRRLSEPAWDDVKDPIGRPASVHLEMGDAIAGALGRVVDELVARRQAAGVSHDLRRAS
jgi:protein-tyrosine phosphatase